MVRRSAFGRVRISFGARIALPHFGGQAWAGLVGSGLIRFKAELIRLEAKLNSSGFAQQTIAAFPARNRQAG
jgi:hypothetical protein